MKRLQTFFRESPGRKTTPSESSLKNLLADRIDVLRRMEHGWTILHLLILAAPPLLPKRDRPFTPEEAAAEYDNGAMFHRFYAYQIRDLILVLASKVRGSNIEVKQMKLLLSAQDDHGHTALHYAANQGRPDLVALLRYWAEYAILKENKRTGSAECFDVKIVSEYSLRPFDCCEWDRDNARPADAAYPTSKSLARPQPKQVEGQSELNVASAFGTEYGLLLYTEQYWNESDSAACKRLLFQADMWNAVNAGENGDLRQLERLLSSHNDAHLDGDRIFPLACRHGCSDDAPIWRAIVYDNANDKILETLLEFPWVLQLQSGDRQFTRVAA
jgi:hypothetical protein